MRYLNKLLVALSLVLPFAAPAGALNSGDIITIAGGGPNNTAALSANLFSPVGVAVDGSGNYYIAADDQHRIFKVDGTGQLTVVAGSGGIGFSGDGGPAISARLASPGDVFVDGAGNLFIADTGNQRIRRVDAASGVITTVAGNGTDGFSGDGGPASAASLSNPSGTALDGAGNLFIADKNNQRIRRVNAATGTITTVAGNGASGFSGDGGPASAAMLNLPDGVALDGAGNLFIADEGNARIRGVDAATGSITTVAGNGVFGFSGDGGPATAASLYVSGGVAVDGAGNLFIGDGQNVRRVDAATGIIDSVAGNGASGFSGDGGPATAASLGGFRGVAVDGGGNLLVADTQNLRIRRVDAATGVINTVAGNGTEGFSGDGGPATYASLDVPDGLAMDADGNIFIADSSNDRIRRIDAATGIISTVAGNGIEGYSGDGGPATAASLDGPERVALDGDGNLLISDDGNRRLRKVDLGTGIITTVAGNGIRGYSGDGGPATAASLNYPYALALDSSGNIIVTDIDSDSVRRIDAATGIISTVAGNGIEGYSGDGGPATAANLNQPAGMAIDSDDNIYFVERNNHVVRRVDADTGIISTVAGNGIEGYSGDGGPAIAASIDRPYGFTIDSDGNFYISDYTNQVVRRIDAGTGIITTVAGNGIQGYSGDGGPATAASLANPLGVMVDSAGNLYISDFRNDRIRVVLASVQGNTATGIDVVVLPEDPAAGTPVTLTFAEVTEAGDTTLTVSATGPSPPAGFLLGTPPLYFELGTSASFTGSVKVCVDYSDTSFDNEASLSLFHEEGGVWMDVTTSLDTVNDIICGEVSSFSPFAIFAANQPPLADAGDGRIVACAGAAGTPITLDGTASSDPEGDPLSYTWTGPFPQGSGTITGASPTVTLPLGTSTVALIVNDGQLNSAPDSEAIIVVAQVTGFVAPLAALVPGLAAPILPDTAFKQGRTLPLKLGLSCGGVALSDVELNSAGKHYPLIAALVKTGAAPLDLATLDLDSGQANDNGLYFRYDTDGSWVYNLKTKGLSIGTYEITIEMPDGQRYTGGFVLNR